MSITPLYMRNDVKYSFLFSCIYYCPGGQISHCNIMPGNCIQYLRCLGKVTNTYLIII